MQELENPEQKKLPFKDCNVQLLLVNPGNPAKKVYNPNKSMYPFSLLFLMSYLKKNGYEYGKILDLSVAKYPEKELENYLKKHKVDVIGFTSTSATRFHVWDLIKTAKQTLPEARIIVGGNHFTYTAEETLRCIPEVDIVARGEGEIILYELMQFFNKEKEIENVQGITYRKAGEIVQTEKRPEEDDLDKLNIDFELVIPTIVMIEGQYTPFMDMNNWEFDNIKTLPIHVGRGCPGKCIYCLYNKKKYRMRKVNSVIEEIKYKMKKYNCDAFHLQDPFLVKRKEFIETFCNRLLNEEIKIKWYAESRVDIDPKLIDLMAKAGCISMDFGLESASPKIIKSIRKGITLDQTETIIERCNKNGIRVLIFTMISLPDETMEDAMKTINFLKKFSNKIARFTGSITLIYPGADLEAVAKEKKILPEDFSWYDRSFKNQLPDITSYTEPLWIEHLTLNQIRQLRKEIEGLNLTKTHLFKVTMKNLIPFLFDWHKQDLKLKRRLVKSFFRGLTIRGKKILKIKKINRG